MTEHNQLQENPVVGSLGIDQTPEQDTRIPEYYRPKLAGFWTRFWAYTIDLIVLYAISGIFIKPLFRAFDFQVSNPWFLLFTPFKITMLILLLLYFTLMTKYFQQTVGKMILGIKVISKEEGSLTWQTLLFREVIGRFISKVLVIPYLLVAFMPKKEALHDIFADTYVIHEDAYDKEVRFHSTNNNVRGEQLPEPPVV